WKYFLGLVERGEDPATFSTAFARFAARAVASGRRLCGQEKSRDVLSFAGQKRHRFAVCPLPETGRLSGTLFEEALHDTTQPPVLDQVAFRFDFPAWLQTRTDRDRRMVQDLMVGERTVDVSRKYGTTPARISQLRRAFKQDLTWFCSERADRPAAIP